MNKLCKDCACENVCGITHLPEHEACEFYKADAITELEKIKAEIKDLLFSYGYLDMHTNNDVLEIIDNYISELKGENE